MSPTGFWSYTRDDDTASDGRLSRLRVILTKELQVQLGRAAQVRIFQDVETIPTGADWDHEIGKALSQSAFFIPIVTPGFVQSRMCCLELMRFREHEAARGRNDLIFPLHYIDTTHLDPDRAGDCHDPEALRLLRARQMFAFDNLRFRDPGREDVLVRISALATAIRDALRRDPPDPRVMGLSLTGGPEAAEQARREAAEARQRQEAEQAEVAARREAEQREAARIAEEKRIADDAIRARVMRDAAKRSKLAEAQELLAGEQRKSLIWAEERRKRQESQLKEDADTRAHRLVSSSARLADQQPAQENFALRVRRRRKLLLVLLFDLPMATILIALFAVLVLKMPFFATIKSSPNLIDPRGGQIAR